MLEIFQPFVPRAVSEPTPVEPLTPPAEAAQKPPLAPDLSQHEPTAEQPPSQTPLREPPPFATFVQAALEEHDRAAHIRAEAVRLACIATGRILRHAVVFDPAVIVRFVEDAVAATHDRAAVTCVHPVHASVVAARGISCRSDERLAFGEVVVDLPTGSIGASLDERAALIVRATADG
ncbi:MAG: hypothetical protein M3Z37_00695 [Candidatus Eremiobacteraeota bacterium]|nr:hypothetical protein [Candidatus Eremiobacteraeota bacterium]